MSATRQLAAIMFTDMVGYTALMQENEQLALQRRDRNQRIFEEALATFGGKLLQYYGDGTMSIFNSAVNSILAAIEMQTLSRREGIDLRIGIHIGDVITDDNGIYGDSVNIASRIESLAVPGSVFISEKLYDDVKNHEGIRAQPMGYFELKNVKQPIQVFAISNEGIVVPSRDEVKGKVKQTLNSIAVLPFSSLSSDPENEFFCDGITEELLNVLAKVEGLQVTSRTSSFAFKGKNEDVREIAAKLNVQKVLEGSVRKSGNRVRITAQLINAADGYHIWSETYDRSLEDIFAVQDDIAREIASKFRINLGERDFQKTLAQAPTKNLEAYMKYLQAISRWREADMSGLVDGIKLFEEASALDPEFLEPYCHLAFLAYVRGENAMLSPAEAAEKCRVAAEAAMKINPKHPLARLASAIYKTMFAFDWKGAREDYDASLAVNPNSSFTWSMFTILKLLTLDFNKIDELEKTIKAIDPLDPVANGMVANMYLYSGQLEKAELVCDEFLKVSPQGGYIAMVSIFVKAARYGWATAIPALEAVKSAAGSFSMLLAVLGAAYAATGDREKAMECIDWLKQTEARTPGAVLDHVAMVYAQLGMEDEFFATVERGYRNRSIISLWIYDSYFLPESLRRHERLKNIRRQAGLPV